MEYNVCKHCGANNGRAGLLINDLCMNCYDTKKTGNFTIHANLQRSAEELNKTAELLNHDKSHKK